MPWQQILNGATGLAALVIVLGVGLAVAILAKAADAFGRRLEAETKHLELSRQIGLESQAKFLDMTRKALLERTDNVDQALRASREGVYKTLWKKTEKLPKWPRNDSLTYQELKALSSELQSWYFGEGGIYLSESARGIYSGVQEAIERLLPGKDLTLPVSDPDYEVIRAQCSRLRTELTKDLYSRREAPELR